MLTFENYSVAVAQRDFENLHIDFIQQDVFTVEPKYVQLREELLKSRDQVFDKLGLDNGLKGKEYQMDLLFGLELYEILSFGPNKVSNRQLGSDDMWRYLALKVIPDVVHFRWGKNADHFYYMTRRLYLKTLFWYIHLSWVGSKEATYELLKNNGTDVIASLVERPGIGYYLDLYREIMKQYGLHKKDSRTIFRPVMKLNTARLKVINPDLVEGGVEQYVADLFKAVIN